MVLIGSLRLVAGLVFLGVVIALCLWLLIRLFPGTPTDPDYSQDQSVSMAFHKGAHPHPGQQKNDETIPK